MLDIKHGRVDGERKRAAEGEAATVLGEPHPSASAKISPVLPPVAATRALTGYNMMAPAGNGLAPETNSQHERGRGGIAKLPTTEQYPYYKFLHYMYCT